MAQGSAPVLGPRGAACPGGAGINSECFFFLFFFCRIKNLNIYPRPLSCYPMIFVNLLQNKRSQLLPPRSPLCSRPGGVQHPRAGSSRALCRAGRGAAPVRGFGDEGGQRSLKMLRGWFGCGVVVSGSSAPGVPYGGSAGCGGFLGSWGISLGVLSSRGMLCAGRAGLGDGAGSRCPRGPKP